MKRVSPSLSPLLILSHVFQPSEISSVFHNVNHHSRRIISSHFIVSHPFYSLLLFLPWGILFSESFFYIRIQTTICVLKLVLLLGPTTPPNGRKIIRFERKFFAEQSFYSQQSIIFDNLLGSEMEKERRKVHPQLLQVLKIDAYLTEKFVKNIEKNLPIHQLKIHYRLLEISAHGILWFPGWLAFIWILNRKDLYQMQVNLLLGLLLDIFFVAILKAITRRRRPVKSDDPFAIGPDKYSFPSGHASRSTYITFFFTNIWPISIIFSLPLIVWTISLCLSRILMKRHHILDIFAGIILGIINGLCIRVMYMDTEICSSLVYWLTDEKLDGGEYHV